MPRIAIPKREDAPAESKPILDKVDKMLGFVPNLHRLMSLSPNALSGWATLMGSLAKTLDVKTRDGIALAVSEADGCDYCLAAHSFIAGNVAKIPADEIELNREGRSSDPKRQAAVAFAKALIETRGKVSDAQFAAVREAGWNRRQHRRDDRADCPVPVDQLHEQCGADPDRFSRGQSREGSLTRGAFLWRGEGWRIQCLDGPRGLVSSASTSRPGPRTARGCSLTASGRAGSRRSMPASTCG
jgi:uncharacterized peroxidase-related enzyme